MMLALSQQTTIPQKNSSSTELRTISTDGTDGSANTDYRTLLILEANSNDPLHRYQCLLNREH